MFLTNGHGEAAGANPIYLDLISRFDPQQAAYALQSFADAEIASQLQRSLSRRKWTELLDVIDIKLTGRPDRDLLEAVREFSGNPNKLRLDGRIRRLLSVARD
ncbi:hypothetical protein [Nonomuraea candida]|uniref:hypothetical protein n=1 Tax=Nonomuraea candida TaxID=359159 RepID=UPI0012FB3A34|nr:hypothetical protein [Nonomuraea candida]